MTYDQLMRWRQAVGAMPASNYDYVRGIREAGDALAVRVEALQAALEYARPLVEKWCHTQGDNAAFFAETLAPIDEALGVGSKQDRSPEDV